MSWLTARRKTKEEVRKLDEWGYMCGYCHQTFKDDNEAYTKHMNNSHLRATEFSEGYQKQTGDKYNVGDGLAVGL